MSTSAPTPSRNTESSQRKNNGSTSVAEGSDVFLDLDRQGRCGFPEAIFGEGKSVEQLLKIATDQLSSGSSVFVTRISTEGAAALKSEFGGRHNEVARTFLIQHDHIESNLQGYVPVVSAGTTDLPVVEETFETLTWMGISSCRVMDVGVAGPHRLPEKLSHLKGADAIVVVAGMEGALPSVVAGYVDCPVIAVPTSVGYGANLGGISALLSMLNSCAPNVSVVNIDAGFKGAYVAGLIASRAHKRGQEVGE